MRKIEINLTNEQYQKLNNEIKNGNLLNIQEETSSGFTLKLCNIEGNISWLEFEMQKNIDLGEVNWSFQ
jgi:hypothetical protein